MNSPQPIKKDPQTDDSFFRVLFSWPHCVIVVIIGIIALIALIYAEENWRGKRAWNAYRKQLEMQGEHLDFRFFIPATLSMDENFAADPIIQAWFPRGDGLLQSDNYSEASKILINPEKGERRFMDLVAWEMAFARTANDKETSSQKIPAGKLDAESRSKAAPQILKAMADFQPTFDAVREASHKTKSRYPITYELEKPWGILLPHLASLKGLGERLKLKACAELATGNGETALHDVKLALFLADTLKNEPFLISHLVRLSALQIALHPVWEGLVEQRWTDGQLQELQNLLLKYDMISDLKQPLGSEQAMSVLTIDLFRKDRKLAGEIFGSNPLANTIAQIAPSGWFYQEQRNYCTLFQLQFKDVLSITNGVISPSLIKANSAKIEFDESHLADHTTMARILLPALGKTLSKSAKTQVLIDQTIIACALERYRLKHRDWPEKLDAVISEFAIALPADVVTGTSYKYRRESGSFVLYSRGWNEKDEGGVSGKTLFDEYKGDWVWKYPR